MAVQKAHIVVQILVVDIYGNQHLLEQRKNSPNVRSWIDDTGTPSLQKNYKFNKIQSINGALIRENTGFKKDEIKEVHILDRCAHTEEIHLTHYPCLDTLTFPSLYYIVNDIRIHDTAIKNIKLPYNVWRVKLDIDINIENLDDVLEYNPDVYIDIGRSFI